MLSIVSMVVAVGLGVAHSDLRVGDDVPVEAVGIGVSEYASDGLGVFHCFGRVGSGVLSIVGLGVSNTVGIGVYVGAGV